MLQSKSFPQNQFKFDESAWSLKAVSITATGPILDGERQQPSSIHHGHSPDAQRHERRALQLLRLTAASADAFPPLKSAAGGALHIVELVKKFKSNKEKWRDLGAYVQDATASVIQSLARVGGSSGDAEANLQKLKAALEDVTAKIVAEQSLPRRKRIGKFLQDPEMIADMRGRVDNCISLFQCNNDGYDRCKQDFGGGDSQ
ncbi:hypothetical protein FRC09_008766 [Ceratobasidium sp. 395]|nr:hypothetical protein FRC09_008766 [Ceratobasidium sp. 395]